MSAYSQTRRRAPDAAHSCAPALDALRTRRLLTLALALLAAALLMLSHTANGAFVAVTATAAPGVRAAAVTGTRLPLGSRILELESGRGRLLLGARHLGAAAGPRPGV